MKNFKQIKNKKSLFNVGWVTFLIMLGMLLVSTNSIHLGLMIVWTIIGYIGAVIGNMLGRYSMPKVYTSNDSFLGSFKQRFFWNHGPQVIGYFSIYFILLYIFNFVN